MLFYLCIVFCINGISAKNQLQYSNQSIAKLARFVIHISDWTSMASISKDNYPLANIKSISDGPIRNSSGIPYFYMTPMDLSQHDLLINNKCSIMVSLAQGIYCQTMHYDPQDPRCVRVILKGHILEIENEAEKKFATKALFSRHKSMKLWPKDHNFKFTKMNITEIIIINYFGGAKYVKIDDYFNVKIDTDTYNIWKEYYLKKTSLMNSIYSI